MHEATFLTKLSIICKDAGHTSSGQIQLDVDRACSLGLASTGVQSHAMHGAT